MAISAGQPGGTPARCRLGAAHPAADLAVAAALIAAATLVRWWIDPTVGSRLPFLFFIAALIPIAWFCSRLSYILATVASALVGSFFLTPKWSFRVGTEIDQLELIAFILIAAVLGAAAWVSRAARDRAEHARDEADSAARALRESEARAAAHAAELEAVMDAAPAMVLIAHDAECRSVTGNRAVHEFLRIQGVRNLSPANPETDRTWQEFQDGRRLTVDELPMQRAARTGQPVRDCEMDVVFSDGEVRTMFGHAVPLLDGRGRSRGAIGSFVDVTEIKRARRAVQESEAKFRSVFELSLAGISFWHADGRILDANDAYLRLAGYTREELQRGQARWDTLAAPEYQHLDESALHEVLASGRNTPYEKEYLRRDGTRITVITSAALLPGCQDRGIGVVLDVSSRVRVEQALRHSEERFRLMAEAAPVLIGIVDAVGAAEYVNQRFCEFTGLSRRESEGYGWTAAVHPDDAGDVRVAWERARGIGGPFTFECRCRRASGDYHWVTGSAVPIRSPSGTITRWIASATDIHELKRIQEELAAHSEQLARQTRELARSNADLDDFAHIAAHDLKEPLRGIRHNIAFVLEDCAEGLDAAGRERLATVERLAGRMHELIGSLMSYAEMSRAELDRTQEDTSRLVGEAVALLRVRIAEAGARVAVDTPLPIVPCARAQVVQVFSNLIVNGIKYNRSEPKQISIGARAAPGGPPVFYVRDNGIGIKPEHHQSIFRIFRRLHARDEFGGGSGAGLAIVKRIVERHGGRIWVESEHGGGATFYFTLAPDAPRPEPPLVQTLPIEIREPAGSA